tara:strand:- start:24 stop:344 length:321 start_codon:yes stop_codon:yes gene_type:complete
VRRRELHQAQKRKQVRTQTKVPKSWGNIAVTSLRRKSGFFIQSTRFINQRHLSRIGIHNFESINGVSVNKRQVVHDWRKFLRWERIAACDLIAVGTWIPQHLLHLS